MGRGVVKKKGRNELYLCIRRRKIFFYRAVLVCTAEGKKTNRVTRRLGQTCQAPKLLSGVTGRVGETSTYIRPCPCTGCGCLQPQLHW